MSCPCCLPASCDCPGAGCNINITYAGQTTAVPFQPRQASQFFFEFGQQNRFADDGISVIANLRYRNLANSTASIRQSRGMWVAPCMTTASSRGVSVASFLNDRTCPNYEQITSGGYFQGAPINLILCFGEEIGQTVCNMYTVGIDDGSPCPLPLGQPKTRYVLALAGSVRSTGATIASAFNNASKCQEGCDQQLQQVIDTAVITINLPSTTCEPFKAIVHGLSLSGEAAEADLCRDIGYRTGPYVHCLSGGPPVWQLPAGCEVTRFEIARSPSSSDRGTTVVQFVNGSNIERAANGPMIQGISEPSPCSYVISPAQPNNCPNFSGWSFACDLWTHQSPTVSLVCAP